MKCTRCRGAGRGAAARATTRPSAAPATSCSSAARSSARSRRSACSRSEERLLVAVSGGKDSLALWDVLVELGYDTTGLYLGLGIGAYSSRSHEKAAAFAAARGLPLQVVALAEEGPGSRFPRSPG